MKKVRSKSMLLLAVAMVAVMMLSACGGASSSAPSSAPPSSTPVSAAPESKSTDAPESVALDIPQQQLTIGTASAGGAFFPIGTGVAEVISQNVEPLFVTAEITGGSVENPRLVADGEADMGISNADHVVNALAGVEQYDQVYDVSAMFSLHASILHIVTLEKTGITSVADMKGKRVAVGPAGGGSIPMVTAALAAYDMTLDDIIPSYVSYDDGISQLKDGQVDVALVGAGFPAAAVLGLAATDKVVMVSLPDDKMEAIQTANPFYTKLVVPADVYGTDGDITVLGVRNLVFCSNDLSEDTVYAMTKAIYENLDDLKTYHNALSDVEQATMSDVGGVKLHPGAERFFKEVGLL